tara:strand:+ start:2480 stop:4126 length:1647 start_codon:yes stop_codon:yes gene_type:complete
MAEAAMIEEEIKVPEGGIADFIMDDADADAIYGADEVVPSGGIGQFEDVAQEMAAAGREGDDVIAHLETGELIIPKALLEQNPEMKNTIFAFLESKGIEDPQRYVVGSDSNSINPETGAPEFFGFFKKAFKKITKTVKKVAKKVVKVVKKIAPVVLPIVGTMFFGPIWGAALGSGIASLINGASIKDALKSAVISGATGAVASGIGSLTSGGTFMGGVKSAASLKNVSAGFEGIGKALKGDFSGASYGNMKQGPTSEGGTAFDPSTLVDQAGENALITGGEATITTGENAIKPLPNSGTFTNNIKQAFTPGEKTFGQGISDAFMPKGPTAIDVLNSQNINPMMASQTQLEAAKLLAKEAAPSLVAKYAPMAAAGTLAAAGAGAFKTPEQENPDQVRRDADGNIITGESLIAGDPSNYLIGDLGNRRLNPNTGQYEDVAAATINNSPYTIPTNYRFNNPYGGETQVGGPFLRPQMMAADGGEVYPRRNGGIMPDEGIPNQDSVRAMLMPGEFVMTTDAVKGLGNGNMNQGINNMYSVMRGLENKGRTTA